MTLEPDFIREYKEAVVRLASLHSEAIRIGNLMCDVGRLDLRPGKISDGQFSSTERNTKTLKLLAQEMRDTNSLIQRLRGTLPIGLVEPVSAATNRAQHIGTA